MEKRPLLSGQEGKVDQILLRRLAGSRFRVCPKVRLSDAVNKKPGQYLSRDEFSILSHAHFDFLIATRTYPPQPIFAVEFDGPYHRNPEQKVRDILKNRLCSWAELPLLRIRCNEIEEHDKMTLLDYMLQLFIAWEMDQEEILEESRYDPDLSPQFLLSLRHPFPAIKAVEQRLLSQYRIVRGVRAADTDGQISFGVPDHLQVGQHFLCDAEYRRSGNYENDEFHTVEMEAVVAPVNHEGNPVFNEVRKASVRSWLPLDVDLPSADDLPSIWEAWGSVEDIERIGNEWIRRVDGMWFPDIPGISPPEIADNFVEYLSLRAVEEWAQGLSHLRFFVN